MNIFNPKELLLISIALKREIEHIEMLSAFYNPEFNIEETSIKKLVNKIEKIIEEGAQ